jgi:hypothetical protein
MNDEIEIEREGSSLLLTFSDGGKNGVGSLF